MTRATFAIFVGVSGILPAAAQAPVDVAVIGPAAVAPTWSADRMRDARERPKDVVAVIPGRGA